MNKKNRTASVILFITSVTILIPISTILLWIFTERWSWPNLLPEVFSLRAIEEILSRTDEFLGILSSSIFISTVVGLLSVVIGLMSARAFVFYEFKGKNLLYFISLMPFMVPSTVFAIGIQVTFIKWGLSNTVIGVIITHLIYSLPYALLLLIDGTKGVGIKLEEQARVLGATSFVAFYKISLPLLIPIILSSFSMAYIVSFSQYFLTLLIGGGSVKTFAIVMVPYLQNGSRNIACVYSGLFLFITILVFEISKTLADNYSKNYHIGYYS